MRTLRSIAVGVLAATAALSHAYAQVAPPSVTTLTVKGNVERELVLSIDDLKHLPVQRFEDARTVCDTGTGIAAPEAARRYTGALLRDVLDRAKPVERNRFDLRKSIVIVTASDGYRAVFSWAELYLSPIGEGALVVYERDGAPLADAEGPLALLSFKDTRAGPRHVKWLRSVELRVVGD